MLANMEQLPIAVVLSFHVWLLICRRQLPVLNTLTGIFNDRWFHIALNVEGDEDPHFLRSSSSQRCLEAARITPRCVPHCHPWETIL
jgi:hypothetical protein